jgi:Protein of unknown function (DUF3300)
MMRRGILRCGAMLAAVTWTVWAQAPPQYPNYPQQPSYPQAPAYPQQTYPQPTYPQAAAPAAPQLSPQELSNLVAPIALYPDMLLSEVLAASTYPLELTQAEQWIESNPGLQGRALVDAAKQQNWDPSVQALVAFPDVLNTLTRDIQWTTALGNAFLAQQAAVMDAIQQLRAEARAKGRLADTPQQRVVMDQGAIEIQPTDPQVVYPPVYNPEYVWGPPVYGAYPVFTSPASGYGIGFAAGTVLSGIFTGLLAYGGWGWGLSWLTHGLFLNGLFFSHFGFHGLGGGFGGPGYYGGARVAWVHNPAHRLGVPYGNRYAAARGNYGARSFYNPRAYNDARSYSGGRSSNYGSGYQAGNRQMEAYRGLTERESRGSAYSGSGSAYRGSGSSFASRNYQGRGYERRNFEAHNASSHSSEPHYSAPKSSGHFGGEHFSGHSHSGGGHSGGGGHSHGGGHHHK